MTERSEDKPHKQRLVIYHGGCPDGFGAAWACWRKWGDTDTEYVPLRYQQGLDADPTDRDVWLVDCSLKRAEFLDLCAKANSVRVLDHHITAMEDIGDLPQCTFDMTRSGAGLTWDTLHPDTGRPWFIDYIEDRDLWTWKLPNAEDIISGLDLYAREFKAYDELFAMGKEGLDHCHNAGRVVRNYLNIQVQRARGHKHEVELCGYKIPAVNSCLFQSEIGNVLVASKPVPPFVAVWFQRKDGTYKVSLRSCDEQVDVAKIAEQFGGGGHRNASGFACDELPWDA